MDLQESWQEEKRVLLRDLRRRAKILRQRLKRADEQLTTCNSWSELHHEGLLLQSHLYLVRKGMSQVAVTDWEDDNKERIIILDPLVEPHKEVEKRFKISKKLQKGIPYQERLIQQASEEIERNELLIQSLEKAEEQQVFEGVAKQINLPKPRTEEAKVLFKQLPYREFTSEAGVKIWVGKSAKDNDRLTFQYANGSDWWLHASGVPGSHVVIHTKDEPDAETLKDAVQLALHYSKAKGEGDVCITQCKHVTHYGKGHAGRVYISNQRTIYSKADSERLNRLRKG
ncbi:MAG: DUF814 domain-containing protein [Parachlamydiaceae bacterium]|nr:DUF814 domain-containing protein [Parachlamydiaceae bacterium]